jgi:hypothetical protein
MNGIKPMSKPRPKPPAICAGLAPARITLMNLLMNWSQNIFRFLLDDCGLRKIRYATVFKISKGATASATATAHCH